MNDAPFETEWFNTMSPQRQQEYRTAYPDDAGTLRYIHSQEYYRHENIAREGEEQVRRNGEARLQAMAAISGNTLRKQINQALGFVEEHKTLRDYYAARER